MTRRQEPTYTLTFGWNYDNKPTTITNTAGVVTTFLYDGNSQRVRKTGTQTTLY
jgi:YD repeat-containing protein